MEGKRTDHRMDGYRRKNVWVLHDMGDAKAPIVPRSLVAFGATRFWLVALIEDQLGNWTEGS